MVEPNKSLNRLCRVYEELAVREKEEIIRLAEGLLNTQMVMCGEKPKAPEKTGNSKLKDERRRK